MLARAAAVDNAGAGRTLARMALAKDRHGEFLREFRRDVKILMWEFSIGFAATFAGLGIIIAGVAP